MNGCKLEYCVRTRPKSNYSNEKFAFETERHPRVYRRLFAKKQVHVLVEIPVRITVQFRGIFLLGVGQILGADVVLNAVQLTLSRPIP